MQLELFDIRTADTGRKDRIGQAAAKNGRPAAGPTTGAQEKNGADFLASLRTVSEEGQPKTEDLSTAADGLNLNPADTQPTRLSDVLNEIIRAWPTGRRPAGTSVTGVDSTNNAGPEFLSAKAGQKSSATSGPAAALPEPGNARISSGRIKKGLDGFTAALIKRLGRATDQRVSEPFDGPAIKAASAAAETTGKQGSRQGIRILNLSPVSPSNIDMSTIVSRATKVAEKTGASASKPAAITAPDGLKGTLPQSGPPTAGRNELPDTDIKEKTAVVRESRITQPNGQQSRSAADAPTLKTVLEPLDGSKLQTTQARPTVADQPQLEKLNVSMRVAKADAEPGTAPASSATGKTFQAKTDQVQQTLGKSAAAAVSTGDKSMAAGLETERRAIRLQTAPVDADTAAVKTGQKGRAAVQAEERFDLSAAKPAVKTGSVSEHRAAATRADFNPADRENLNADSTGQATSREARGIDQPRFEVADAKVKPAESAPAAPKAQAAATAAAQAPEADKTVLDRIAEARVLEQIAAKVRLHPKNGANEIRLQLRPETLGQMQLKILAQDQTISVKMVAETAMAREIIENNISQLRADLNALGLNVDKLDVEVVSTQDPGEKDAPGQRGGFAKHGRGTAHHGRHDNEAGDEQTREPQSDEDETEEGNLVGVFA